MRIFKPWRALVAAAAAAPSAVLAHTGLPDTQDALHGFMHPIAGLDHVLAMVAVGVIAAQLGGKALWALPMCFVAVMAIAGASAMGGQALPGAEVGIALSAFVLGVLIARSVKLPVVLLGATVALFAVFHGHAHGVEMAGGSSGMAFGFGFVSATALLHLVGVGLGLALGRAGTGRGQHLARAGGGAVALAGALLLAGSFS